MQSANPRRVDLALLAVAAVWGSSYLATKQVVTGDGVFAFLSLRLGLAVAGLALFSRLSRLTIAELAHGVAFGAALSAVFALETAGVARTSATNAGLIIALTIVLTPALDQLIGGHRLPAAFYGATTVAVAGVALLTQRGGLSVPTLGDGLILAAATARAAHIVVVARYSRGRVLDAGRVTFVQLATCLAVFVAVSSVTGPGIGAVATRMDAPAWALLGYLALVCTVFAFLAQTWALRRTSAARVGLLLGTEPLWALAVGVAGGDPLTALGLAGAVLIVVGTQWGRAAEARAGTVEVPQRG